MKDLWFILYHPMSDDSIMNKKWWKAAGIRAIKTVAQAAVAVIGTTVMLSEVDWAVIVSTSLLAGLLSLLTSVGGLPEVE